MQPIFMVSSVYADAIRVPVVSLMRAASLMGRPRLATASSNGGTTSRPSTPSMSKPFVHRWRMP